MATVKKVKKYQNAPAPIRKGASRTPILGLRKAVVNEGINNADVMDPKFDPMKMQKLRADATKKSYYEKGGKVTKAKDGKWIQKATASIKKRGTAGKCTPITKPGCTGKAKTLAKTFKKMAKARKK